MADRRVVITGIGAVTPVGLTARDTFANLMAGRSGVTGTTRFDPTHCPVKRSGEVHGFDPSAYGISPRDLRTLDRYQRYVIAAAQEALADATLDLPPREITSRRKNGPAFDRYGVAVGVAFSSTEVLGRQLKILEEKGARHITPRLFNQTLPNAATSVLSVRFGLRGPLVTVSGASASGHDSIIAAYDRVRHGRAEIMLAGGAESAITEIIVAGFAANHTGSARGACRPFDVDRDGTVLGEGAGILVLEEAEHAARRGARVHGEMLGYGQRGDAYDMSDIPPDDAPGMRASLEEALADAELRREDVGYVNVHGTGTKSNDPAETVALRQVFGGHVERMRVSGIKGATGHMLGGSGAVEVIVALLASRNDRVPPTHGLTTPAAECELHHVIGQGVGCPVPVAISTSVGMGGNNSAIAVRGV